MSVAFWSVKLSGAKPVEVQPPEGYVLNVQQAALSGEGHAVVKISTVSVEGEKLDAVICTLRSKTTDQANLSLVFGYDVPVSFSAEGKADVYLSGYFQPGPEEEGSDDENDFDNYDSEEEDSEDDEEEEEGSDDEDEEANIRNAEAAIAKLGAGRAKDTKAIKGVPADADSEEDSEEGSEEDDEDSDDDDEDDDEEDRAFIHKMVAKHGLDKKAPKSSRVQELPSDEDSEEEDSEEEAPPVKVQKVVAKGVVTPAGQKPKQNNNNNNNNNNNKPKQNGGNNNNYNKNQNQGGNKNNNNQKSGDKRKR